MKIMIRSDIEGVTGVTTYQQADGSAFGQAMLMHDLAAVIEGLLSTGQHEIVIYDEHTDGQNIDLEQLPPNVMAICGKPPYRPDWGGIDSSFQAVILVGYHARSSVPDALLGHSYSRKNLNIRINGTVLGEIGMESAIAGDFDVPVLLVTGDSAGMKEAQEILPGVRTVSVKESMGQFQALCYSPKKTTELLREAAKEIITSPPKVGPLKFEGPIALEIELAESDYLSKLKLLYPDTLIDKNTAGIKADTVTAAWSEYCCIQSRIKEELRTQNGS